MRRCEIAKPVNPQGADARAASAASWYSAIGDTYHTEAQCIHGQRVRREFRREGTGRRRHCVNCEGLALRRKAREGRKRGRG